MAINAKKQLADCSERLCFARGSAGIQGLGRNSEHDVRCFIKTEVQKSDYSLMLSGLLGSWIMIVVTHRTLRTSCLFNLTDDQVKQ